MELSAGLRDRYSCRRFSDAPLSQAEVTAVLEDAKWAPSAGNLQPWKVKVLDAETSRAFIAQLETLGWESVLSSLRLAIESHAGGKLSSEALNEKAVQTYEREVRVTGAPTIVAVYLSRPGVRDTLREARARLSMLGYRLRTRPGLGVKLRYAWTMLLRSFNDFAVARSTRVASVAGFTYALTLAAFARDIESCIQFSYNCAHREVRRFLGLRRGEELFGIVLLGGRVASEAVSAVNSRNRKPLDVTWMGGRST